MKKMVISILLVSLMSLSACGNTGISTNDTTNAKVSAAATSGEIEYSLPDNLPPKKLIIDTDTGADDAAALILAAKSKNADILGVTTLVGNVDLEQSTQNALMALEMAGSKAPVYKGASERFNGDNIEIYSVFGSDAMGEADLIHPIGKAEDWDAVSFILDTVRQNPDEVEIVVLGPATNIANAIKKDPEIMKKVKMIWSMGTTGLGHGNASPVAEFNVYGDPDAYKVMLDFGVPVTIIGLDCCDGEALWTNEQFNTLSNGNDIGKYVAASFIKLRDFYAKNGSADSVMNCDTLAMCCVLNPEFVKDSFKAHGSCIVDKGECYGQVVFYKEGFNYDMAENNFDYNVTLITEVDKSHYFDMFRTIVMP